MYPHHSLNTLCLSTLASKAQVPRAQGPKTPTKAQKEGVW